MTEDKQVLEEQATVNAAEQTPASETPANATEQVPASEATANAAAETPASETPEDVKQELERVLRATEEKQRLLDETLNRLKRLQADFDNFRRRTRQEKEEIGAIVTKDIMVKLLPVLDNFERALAMASGGNQPEWFAGIEMIYRQLMSTLERLGLTPIDAVGKPFDPNLHEAVARVEDDTYNEVTVIEELQKGYQLHGKTIRPSMVKVAGS